MTKQVIFDTHEGARLVNALRATPEIFQCGCPAYGNTQAHELYVTLTDDAIMDQYVAKCRMHSFSPRRQVFISFDPKRIAPVFSSALGWSCHFVDGRTFVYTEEATKIEATPHDGVGHLVSQSLLRPKQVTALFSKSPDVKFDYDVENRDWNGKPLKIAGAVTRRMSSGKPTYSEKDLFLSPEDFVCRIVPLLIAQQHPRTDIVHHEMTVVLLNFGRGGWDIFTPPGQSCRVTDTIDRKFWDAVVALAKTLPDWWFEQYHMLKVASR